jgi:hypothetical protein
MCCFFTALVFVGPRAAVLVWWLVQPARWSAAIGEHFFVAFMGFLFLPWTLLGWVTVAPGGVDGFDYVILGLAFFIDILSYSGSLWGNKEYAEDYAY